MSDLHYFPRYSSKENATTNNTLLLLLRLYQYNRYKFEKLIEALLTVDQEIPLPTFGLQFSQQKTTGPKRFRWVSVAGEYQDCR